MRYLDRKAAAQYLVEQCGVRTTAQGLADKASKRTGPRYSIINGRALYLPADLDAWVAEQASQPVRRGPAGEAVAA
jgi:hypothetical protein